MQTKKFDTEIEGKELSIELGKLAQQANGSALVRYGQTVVLGTVVMSKESTEKPYFPLMVDYEEKFYAAGKIKGSRWVKREGRPSDEAILTGRLVDRTIRPLFNHKIRNDIQIVLTVLSFDGENDPALPALVAASMAISISDIPWNGPMAGISIGQNENGKWIITPTLTAKEKTGSEIIIAGIEKDKEILINMLEGQGSEIEENNILEGIDFAKKYIKNLIEFQKKIIEEIKPNKKEIEINEMPKELKNEIEEILKQKLEKAIYTPDKSQRDENLEILEKEIVRFVENRYEKEPDDSIKKEKVNQAIDLFEEKIDETVHYNVIKKDKRPDGRKLDEVRKITTEIGILPRTHGSGLFKRGETQVLSIITLGPPGAEQYFDQMELEGTKRFMHDYNFPPFSVGDIGPMRGPGRREIGHGALAEKALKPIAPDREKFPYTIRVVSEVLGSNGSSSMGSVCGSTLALLDAGVPIKANVSGVAMGLISDPESKKYKILTDIQGPEDHYGDMDLKIAGTKKGVTAIQMDTKIQGVKLEILKDAFKQAKKGRSDILNEMEKTIKQPKSELSPLAPRVYVLQINPSKIGLVIGSGGKTINEITTETGASIDIEDDGTIFVSCENADMAKKAIGRIKSLTREVKVGEEFQAKIVKITDFGAFAELCPGQEGLIHISELNLKRGQKIDSAYHRGDTIDVKVKSIDESGKIGLKLTRKDSKENNSNHYKFKK